MKSIVSGMLFVLLSASILAAALSVQPAKATDVEWWPMFHHDLTHTGTSTSTGPTTNNTIWNYTTGGSVVCSSPAVAGGLVYVGWYDGNVYCLNAANGKFVWYYSTGNSVLSSPAVVGGLVYVGSWDKNVYCLNAATGTLVWNYTTGNAVDSSPAVVGGLVYVGAYDENVYCLNAGNGTLVWSYTTGGSVFSSPAVVGGLVYVGSIDDNTYCLNAGNGTLVWSYTTGNAVKSSPAVVNGVVYVGSSDGKIYAFGPSSSPPLTVSISPTSVTLNVSQSQLFNSTVSGGTSPYSYQWYLNGLAVSGATNATWTFAPTSAGSYTVYVNVTDGVGAQATSNTATAPTVPEFPSYVVLPLFMMATLLAAFVLKRKRNVRI